MKRVLALTLPLLLLGPSAWAANATGSAALALASLVGGYQGLSGADKAVLANLLEGGSAPGYSASGKITVVADGVVCRSSNVDIAAHSCDLTFGKKTVALKGRKAHELFATILEAGVPPDGAAGSNFEALSHLKCTIDPAQIRQKAGGGADCAFDPGPP